VLAAERSFWEKATILHKWFHCPTEKAFPESESVITTAIQPSGAKSVGNEIVYEHRIGALGQYEVMVPVDFHAAREGGS